MARARLGQVNGVTVCVIVAVCVVGYYFAFARSDNTPPNEWGKFEGAVQTEWLEDGRNMRILSDFAFIDATGKRWPCPKDWKVDGASIPRPLWSIVGGPFEGNYRKASVIHDYACDTRTEKYRDVHRAFYNACRCAGVNETHAKLLYYGVLTGGPQWRDPGSPDLGPSGGAAYVPELTEDNLRAMEEFFEKDNPSLEEIEHMAGAL